MCIKIKYKIRKVAIDNGMVILHTVKYINTFWNCYSKNLIFTNTQMSIYKTHQNFWIYKLQIMEPKLHKFWRKITSPISYQTNNMEYSLSWEDDIHPQPEEIILKSIGPFIYSQSTQSHPASSRHILLLSPTYTYIFQVVCSL